MSKLESPSSTQHPRSCTAPEVECKEQRRHKRPAPIHLDLVWTAKAAQERTQGTGEVSDLGGGRNAKEEMKLEEEQALRNAAEAGEFG